MKAFFQLLIETFKEWKADNAPEAIGGFGLLHRFFFGSACEFNFLVTRSNLCTI